ncbi:DUF1565 domain-containing protein [Shouchella tritolerans]|uniref:DUF1565 domain-containing protein n=1 Tax=Shouchella tritolerans TaxID=2979466 RepID=UPI0021E89B76|nr:DUF1565 domain-containing protein [Shouchella tritolerans]
MNKKKIFWTCFLVLLVGSAAYFSTKLYPTSGARLPATAETEIRDYYVSPPGKDTNPGTMNAPFASIQKAIELVKPGGTVFLMEGVYHQTVSINKSGSLDQGYISLRNVEGQTAIIDGKGVKQVEDGIIRIDNASYVRVEGIEIRHFYTSSPDVTPVGIHVSGSGRNIEMIGNRIHDMGTNADQRIGGGNAHGIAVYGNSATIGTACYYPK